MFARGVADGRDASTRSRPTPPPSFFRVRPEIVHDVAAPAVTVTSIGAERRQAPAHRRGRPCRRCPAPGAEPRQFSIFVQQYAVNGGQPGGNGRVGAAADVS